MDLTSLRSKPSAAPWTCCWSAITKTTGFLKSHAKEADIGASASITKWTRSSLVLRPPWDSVNQTFFWFCLPSLLFGLILRKYPIASEKKEALACFSARIVHHHLGAILKDLQEHPALYHITLRLEALVIPLAFIPATILPWALVPSTSCSRARTNFATICRSLKTNTTTSIPSWQANSGIVANQYLVLELRDLVPLRISRKCVWLRTVEVIF